MLADAWICSETLPRTVNIALRFVYFGKPACRYYVLDSNLNEFEYHISSRICARQYSIVYYSIVYAEKGALMHMLQELLVVRCIVHIGSARVTLRYEYDVQYEFETLQLLYRSVHREIYTEYSVLIVAYSTSSGKAY